MIFSKCDKCKEYHRSNEKCNPIFYFKHEDWGDNFEEIRALDFEDAALKFAQLYNQDECILLNSDTDVIISDGKNERIFKVFAEPEIHYSCKEI